MPAKKGVPNWRKGKGKVIKKTCATCKKEFTTFAWYGKGKFCSSKCKNHATGKNHPNWKGGKVLLTCPVCSEEFLRDLNESTGIRYCSRKCAAQRLTVGGESNPNWRGGRAKYYGPNWKKQRKLTRKRDNYTCQKCGIKEGNYRQELDVHHIKPFRDFNYIPGENTNYLLANNINNLISLCMSCHKEIEPNG